MVKRLKQIRSAKGYSYRIMGVGGVMNVKDYKDYLLAGADSVMSSTGSLWHPYLAQEIKKSFLKH